jgi:hypothetical protein
MTSSISWLDYSEAERRKMLDVISLFQQKESRDELGVGTVRDSFADIFFPGTSTIQTRARYFLFVPWIYLDLERRKKDSDTTARDARKREYDLIEALIASGEDDGVIGKLARRGLQRLPSNIYWSGLQKWNILLFKGSQAQYHKWFDKKNKNTLSLREFIEDPECDIGYKGKGTWNANLPKMPDGFPNKIDFKLKKSEAQYLKDQILRHCSNSLLAFLVLNGHPCNEEVRFAWMHPQYNEFGPQIKERLEHARNFSEIMHGAAWLYNVMLSEEVNKPANKSEQNDSVNRYRQAMLEWYKYFKSESTRFSSWNKKLFWEIVAEQNPRVPNATKTFCMQWINYAINSVSSFEEFIANVSIRSLIKDRERSLKKENARLSNSRALEAWRGESGIGQLDYRWRIARTMVKDILTGLAQEVDDAKAN